MSYTIYQRLANVIFPVRCIFCRRDIHPDSNLLVCPKCEKLYSSKAFQTFKMPDGLGLCRFALQYQGNVRSAILRYKFGARPQYAKSLAHFMLPLAQAYMDFDYISWVPVSPLRYMRRTYNQAKLLAAILSISIGVPHLGTLIKLRTNKAQSKLSIEERQKNVRGLYLVRNKARINGARILLVDDVVTTGSTLEECAKTLYEKGAAEVAFIALAHGIGKII